MVMILMMVMMAMMVMMVMTIILTILRMQTNRWGQLWGRLVPLEILLLQQVCIVNKICPICILHKSAVIIITILKIIIEIIVIMTLLILKQVCIINKIFARVHFMHLAAVIIIVIIVIIISIVIIVIIITVTSLF